MTIHSRSEELVAAAIDFDLTPSEDKEVAGHLATCQACRMTAAAYSTDAYALREIAYAEPPAQVRSAVLAAADLPVLRTIRPWTLLAAAALLLGLTIGAVLIASLLLRSQTPLAGGPLIVYQVRGTFADIFTIDVASGERTQIGSVQLSAPIGGQRIQWTADGRSAFVFGDPDHVQARIDLGAGTVTPLGLSIDVERDEVSPRGDRVARVLGDTERGMRLSVVDLTGTVVLDAPFPTDTVIHPGIAWAPDGTSVVLSGCTSCDPSSKVSPTDYRLFLVPLDGGPMRELTDDATGFDHARFSPDGLTIAYSTVTCHDECTGGISTTSVSDGRITQLTTSGPDAAPAWSPEGDRIAFQRGGRDGGIYVMDRDGSNLIRLTTADSDLVDRDRAPVWSPNAAWVAFTRDPSETSLGDVWIVPSEGGDERLLAQNAVADWGPTATMLAVLPSAPASTSPSARSSTRPVASAATSTEPLASGAPSGEIPLGGSLLLVFQIDGTTRANATTQSVFLMDLETGERTKVGTLPFTEATCCPASVQWSADRQHVALYSVLGLQAIVDLGAGEVEAARAEPAGQFTAAISRRGDRIARIDQVSGRAETIVMADLAGQELARLTVPGERHIEELAWSPDDRTLAVIGQTYPNGDPDSAVTHLFLVPLDGSPPRDLIDNAAEVSAAPALPARTSRMYGYVGAAWSPDGKAIAIADRACDASRGHRTVNGVEVPERYTCAGRLLTLDATTAEQTVVMHDEGVPGPPSWAPDGRRLAFGQFAGEGELGGLPNCYPCESIGLFVIDLNGGNLTRLADGDGPPDWSPDGMQLVFPRYDWELPEDALRSEVWVVPAAGGQARLIAERAAAGW